MILLANVETLINLAKMTIMANVKGRLHLPPLPLLPVCQRRESLANDLANVKLGIAF